MPTGTISSIPGLARRWKPTAAWPPLLLDESSRSSGVSQSVLGPTQGPPQPRTVHHPELPPGDPLIPDPRYHESRDSDLRPQVGSRQLLQLLQLLFWPLATSSPTLVGPCQLRHPPNPQLDHFVTWRGLPLLGRWPTAAESESKVQPSPPRRRVFSGNCLPVIARVAQHSFICPNRTTLQVLSHTCNNHPYGQPSEHQAQYLTTLQTVHRAPSTDGGMWRYPGMLFTIQWCRAA